MDPQDPSEKPARRHLARTSDEPRRRCAVGGQGFRLLGPWRSRYCRTAGAGAGPGAAGSAVRVHAPGAPWTCSAPELGDFARRRRRGGVRDPGRRQSRRTSQGYLRCARPAARSARRSGHRRGRPDPRRGLRRRRPRAADRHHHRRDQLLLRPCPGDTAVSGSGRPARPRTLVVGLTGATRAGCSRSPDAQMLAAIATERGVWVAQSTKGDRFAAQHLLTGGGLMPSALAAAWLGGESTRSSPGPAPRGRRRRDPRSHRLRPGLAHRRAAPAPAALTVAGGHRVDELGVAARAGARHGGLDRELVRQPRRLPLPGAGR